MAICSNCQSEFDLIDGFGSHCSRRCAVRTGNKRLWSDEELEYLTSLVGSEPVVKIISQWNSIAKERGWVERSPESIKIKATRLFKGKGTKAHNDNFGFAFLAKQLNITIDRIQKWELLGLEVENYSQDSSGRSHIKCVSKQSLTNFARLHPEEFWGISRDALERFFVDRPLARAVFKSINQPTVGRTIAIVDLKYCAVYSSAKHAATVLDLRKATILNNAKIDSNPNSKSSKHNFAQLDYPVWWITREHASVVHEIAGEVLFKMHSEYVEVQGYSKQRFLSLGVAIAVRIAIRSIYTYQQEHGDIPLAKNGELKDIVRRIKGTSEAFQQRFIDKDPNQCFEIIKRTIKAKTRDIFYGRICDKRKVEMYLEEFAHSYIEFGIKFFKRKEFLPKHWQPQTPIEYAYYWNSMLATIFMKREVGKATEIPRKIFVRVMAAYQFIQKRGLEFSGVEHNESYVSHQQQVESNENLFENELAEFIEKTSDNEHLRAILFALANGFSDKEIAIQLEVSKERFYQYKEQLQVMTKQFMRQAKVF